MRLYLHGQISSASPRWHYVCIWKNNAKVQAPLHMPKKHLSLSEWFDSLNIVAWHCQGIHTGILYMQHLITIGMMSLY